MKQATRTVVLIIVGVLAVVASSVSARPLLPDRSAAAAVAGGATINCSNADAILGPLQSSVTLAAGTSGSLRLGGLPDGGKGQYVGNCLLAGTVPSGWTVAEGDWVALSATSGSGNSGTFTLATANSTFTDGGTFLNAGTFEDDSAGLTQLIAVGNFVNTGTVVANGGSFGTAGTTSTPSCPSCTFIDRGQVQVKPKQSFTSGSIFVLEPGGTVEAQGSFDIANESTFDVEGGSVTAGEPTTGQFLGQGAATIKFGGALPATSVGTLDVATSILLQGVIARHWTIDNTGGSIAASHAGNAGTFVWNDIDNSTFSDSTAFTNSGTFTDNATGFTQRIAVSRFVNTGTVTSNAPGFGLAGTSGDTAPVFVDRGNLTVAPKAAFSSAGVFELAAGGTIVNHGSFSITGSTLDVTGGSSLGNPLTALYYLGAQPDTVQFAPVVPAGSAGTINLGIGTTLDGVIPAHWVLANLGGPGPAITARKSGNKGTLLWGAGGPLTTSGTFVNAGIIKVTGGGLALTAPDFINAAGGRVLVDANGGIADSGNVLNRGSLQLGAGNHMGVLGNYAQTSGGGFTVAAAGNFSVGSLSVAGTATLGGTLTVDKTADLTVQAGSAVQFVTAHAFLGKFKTVRFGGPGPSLAVTYGPGSVTLAPSKARRT